MDDHREPPWYLDSFMMLVGPLALVLIPLLIYWLFCAPIGYRE
ncbi:MAG TPA: hypothetical protein VFB96_26325 [Pirellulaceae bacterium]|jgi:hypothetical protein|nr:hypothetical protein [Pirellulaceae bacterium]